MISIRLSNDEYKDLKDLCDAQGARSVSDMARRAMQHLLRDPGGDHSINEFDFRRLQGKVSALEERVNLLDREVVRVAGTLESERLASR